MYFETVKLCVFEALARAYKLQLFLSVHLLAPPPPPAYHKMATLLPILTEVITFLFVFCFGLLVSLFRRKMTFLGDFFFGGGGPLN